MESLQEELYKSETHRDEVQVKLDLMEKQLEEAQAREQDLQVGAKQVLPMLGKNIMHILHFVETCRPSSQVEGRSGHFA